MSDHGPADIPLAESGLESLVYVSSATKNLTDEDLRSLLDGSRQKNARLGLTGVLFYSDGNFIQCLEGPAEALTQLYASILRDPRHAGVILLHRAPLGRRLFPDWTMACHRLTRGMWTGLRERLTAEGPTPVILKEFLLASRMLGPGDFR